MMLPSIQELLYQLKGNGNKPLISKGTYTYSYMMKFERSKDGKTKLVDK